MLPLISDFGLSREMISGDEDYSSTGNDSLMPLKWMVCFMLALLILEAPEALKSNHFTKATDIWSFGIVSM